MKEKPQREAVLPSLVSPPKLLDADASSQPEWEATSTPVRHNGLEWMKTIQRHRHEGGVPEQ